MRLTTKYRVTIISLILCQTPPAYSIGWFGKSLDGMTCSGGDQGYGPYDYTNPQHRRDHLRVVEKHHFTPNVKNLISGQDSGTIFGDLRYTLMAFPNHHQALFSVIRYATEKDGLQYMKPECYLQRAEVFTPKDATVQFLFGLYLHRKDLLDQALERYQKGLVLQPGSAEGHYNTGLLYMELGRPEDAVKHARRAYILGYPLPGLKQKLARAGYSL